MGNPTRRAYLGESVHYVAAKGTELACHAATVTARKEGNVASLFVMTETKAFNATDVPHSEVIKPTTFHWSH